jgi:FkbM family methyltransferase
VNRVALRRWRDQVGLYWRECDRTRDFVAIMRVRLSQSKVGGFVTPAPIVVDVDLKDLGPRVRLRSHTTDISVLTEIMLGGSLGQLPAGLEPETVVDLGANIGLSYRWLRARYPRARFVCVEPDPANFEILKANVSAAGGDCQVIAACVGGESRRVRLDAFDGEWGFRLADVDDPSEADTDVLTMAQILERAGMSSIGVLKCDIEGAEVELFADCHQWIGSVDHVVIETHADVVTTDSLLDTIARNGGHFDVLGIDARPHLGFDMVTLRRTADTAR